MSSRCFEVVNRANGVRSKATWLALLALACAASPGPTSVYDLGEPSRSECPHRVLLLSVAELARPYRELARLSATCRALSPRACEQTLLWRGCVLGADAVVMQRSSTVTPNQNALPSTKRGNEGLLVEDAIAVRYDPAAPAP
jgi:hypothetical protein